MILLEGNMEKEIFKFCDFIDALIIEDKENFLCYSKLRGAQQYRIIYETLKKKNSDVTYKDVNSFVRYDKAIKNVLFKYLGTLEEYIRNYIVINFDFAPKQKISKNEYHYFVNLPTCIRKKQPNDKVTLFYRKFSLNFGDLLSFIKKYSVDNFDIKALEIIAELRNKVMHHKPLLFNMNYTSSKEAVCKKILQLKNALPYDCPQSLSIDLNKIRESTKNNISNNYFEFLLDEFMEKQYVRFC